MFSGEWAGAIAYGGMAPTWLERCFRYPEWKTNSDFEIVDEPQFPDDPDGDGLNEGWSRIRNMHFDITVRYDMENTGTGVALGRGSAGGDAFERSNPFVLHQTYEITNISGGLLEDVSFYQLSHTHPANTETPTADVAWDDVAHAFGAHQSYRFDISGFALNSGLVDGFETGSQFHDHVSFSSSMMPAAWGLGSYRGHRPGDPGLPASGGMKPVEGEHCDIENRMLAGETLLTGDEVAGSMRYDLGDLADGQTVSLSFLLAFQSRASGLPAEACLRVVDDTGPSLDIRLDKGPCKGAMPAGPFDVISGSLSDLALARDCDPTFDCVVIRNTRCLVHEHMENQFLLDDDAHELDALFYLARRSGRFTQWGFGLDAMSPGRELRRFFFTPETAPGVDTCDALP